MKYFVTKKNFKNQPIIRNVNFLQERDIRKFLIAPLFRIFKHHPEKGIRKFLIIFVFRIFKHQLDFYVGNVITNNISNST